VSMITFKLNGTEVQGYEGESILQVAQRYGVEIPTLCYHKALEPAGACRLCTVELFDGHRTRFVTACNYPIWEGMEVFTDTEAVHEGRKLIVELLLARCPNVPVIQDLAKKYDIIEPRFTKENDDCILCGLCTRICERMGNSAITMTGRGMDMKVETPFHIQTDVCMACGACISVCPTGHIKLEDITKHSIKPIPSEYERGLKGRKPLYVPYAQAVPNTPVIDRDVCMHFKTGGCQVCAEFCELGAIDFTQQDETIEVAVGSIILAPGFESFDPSRYTHYRYAKHPNVLTSIEFERILSASGPTRGRLLRPSDEREPKKIAWLQCVGSRDIHHCDHSYCSSVCCMYAIKQALISREHSADELDCAIFFMDMRAFGKDFERFYNRADKEGIRFIRTRIPTVEEMPGTDDLELTYLDNRGRPVDERFDMVILSVGMEISEDTVRMMESLGIALNKDSFAETSTFDPVQSSCPGIFTSGAFHAPQDIPSSVTDASAAAAQAGALLSEARFSLSKSKELPPELSHQDIRGSRPRVGVFVCDCGTNIAGVVDVPQVARYAETLPFVEYVAENLFSCSQDTQEAITAAITEQKLNRVVVASCTPQTHEPLFQETVRGAGINKYLFEMANIRNQCSWVHADYPEAATEKAKDLVRMAVEKVIRLEPLEETELAVTQAALVIGGGLAGMAAAKNLADQGYPTYLIEKTEKLGGNALRLFQTWKREDIRSQTQALINQITAHERIEVFTNAEITAVEGFVGNFTTTITANGTERSLTHGVSIIATGATELKATEYCYGEDPRVVSSLELDEMLATDDPRLTELTTCVFIQCVGSRIPERPYCSRVCCTHSVMSALHLKERNPALQVFVLYRDIRTYGLREHVYQEAREKGVVFIRYDHEQELRVERADESLGITFTDSTLKRALRIDSDLLILASAIVREREDRLSQFFKVPVNEDGFFVEAHVKLRPVDFATDGVFFCGLAHSPQSIDESIAQAQAAASRAVTVLSQTTIHSSGIVAVVNPLWCSSCGVCVAVCPYGAPSFNEKGIAEINPVLCKGCGLCTASCRSGAIHLNGFDEGQIMAMIGGIGQP
jgi:heterodisulfide reductase subunit A2